MTTARRTLLKGAAAWGALSAAPLPALAQPFLFSPSTELMPKGKKRRVLVLGGGWGGLSAARHLRETAPDLEVVLLEKNPIFWSCPLSNKWLVDVVDTSFLVHSYTAAARRFGYTYVQTEIADIDRDRKRVHTAQGFVDYDWLVVSAGVRVSYEPWFGNDRQASAYTHVNYSSAYVPSAEHLALKQKIKAFKGGTFVMTLPPPPHRCPPSPYERACLMASYFQRNKIPAKIVILDPKPSISPIGGGYRRAFDELYDDVITYVPNAGVKELDPFNRVVKTAAGDFRFDDAIFMGHHQAADLVWKLGAVGKTAEGKATNWAAVHPEFYNMKDDPNVFVIGDSVGAVSPQFGHYPKSGHIANRMGRSVAQYISQQAKGQPMKPVIIDNLCYMLVNTEPLEAISVKFEYKMGPEGHLLQTLTDDIFRRPQLWQEDLRWYGSMVQDFVGS
ncbi:FAD-dependent oxidoreductase [Polaromonas sp. YR568]|uniref:NAD(P)/FAD-dependent oxidoreductase n=1 Tax=Polaromonas sp. YR568 TaxID=1855301 RepID=UPI003137CCC3